MFRKLPSLDELSFKPSALDEELPEYEPAIRPILDHIERLENEKFRWYNRPWFNYLMIFIITSLAGFFVLIIGKLLNL